MPEDRPVWAVLPASGTAREVAEVAAWMESAGIAGVFAPQLYGAPWPTLAAAACATDRLQLASGVALATTRSAFETAMTAVDLDRLSGGRFVLGLGSGNAETVKGLYGTPYEPPVERVGEVVSIVRAATRAVQSTSTEEWHGRFYGLEPRLLEPVPAVARPGFPIWVAALRTGLARLAGQRADGLIGHPMWTADWAAKVINDVLEPALRAGGRARRDFHVNMWVPVAIHADEETALADARRTVAFYASTAQYEQYFAAQGFAVVARRARDARSSEGPDAAADVVPNAMATKFVHVGSSERVAKELAELWALADSLCILPPQFAPPNRLVEYQSSILDMLPMLPKG